MMTDKTDKDKRTWLMVLLVVGLAVGCLLLLGYLFGGGSPGLRAAAIESPPPTSTSLWDTYEQARAAVRAQAPDAQLVSASTQWQVTSEDALLEATSDWTLVFYSPQSSHALDVVVGAGVARVVNQAQAGVVPLTPAEGNWRAGPRGAWQTFLACGGRTFLKDHPQAVVDLHLAQGARGTAVWNIVASDPESRGLLSVVVDAETGLIVPDSL
jgi:hypothetical protein